MRRRWYYWRRLFRGNRPARRLGAMAVSMLVLWCMWNVREPAANMMESLFEEYGVLLAEQILETWIIPENEEQNFWERFRKTVVFSYLTNISVQPETSEDPAYERLLAAEWEMRKNEADLLQETVETEELMESEADVEKMTETEKRQMQEEQEVIAVKPSGSYIIKEKLADYDYLIQNFYSIHPTTAAGRDMVNAQTFLSLDLSIEKNGDEPQILIYHTHSQEAFTDYPENPKATIVGAGEYLKERLEEKGYQVIHDTSIYDVKDGKLDRSQAYTYALEGIHGILQKYPSIEVVLDLHRDGVAEGTRLVTEVNGKPTAKLMFFNGTSQTPDGPIEYLPNPNRTANMAFSFQMQLLAAERYPGLTRKIYLKGLRYNQHVRARTALVEVGAQTNTYAEALNAMEPLADLLCRVLEGE